MFTLQNLHKQALRTLLLSAQDFPFAVTDWEGETTRYGDGSPRFTLTIHAPEVIDSLLRDPQMGFAEAYMDGTIDVQGDLADVVATAIEALRSPHAAASEVIKAFLLAGAARLTGRRSHHRQKADVAHHYDLSNDFFRLWLDETMTYSCAYFQTPDDTLEQAQRQKVDHVLRKLRLRPDETLLDIGSGWGALVMRATAGYGARALGITLSEEQLEGSCAAIESAGLADRADARLTHYQDLVRERRVFDKIASVGMIEHVGKAHLAEYAGSVAALLRPGGLALLHSITTPEEGPFNGWMEKYIFPGAYLPTLPELLGHYADHGLHIIGVENLRVHYQMTLDHWSERFERHVPEIQAQFGGRFVRMWRLYLRGCSAAFREGTVEVHQTLVSHEKTDALPLTRDDIYRKEASENLVTL